jgi:integrase
MKTKFHRTKCLVKLKKSPYNKGEYYLLIESYPVFEDNSKTPKRLYTSLNRIITTPIWDKDKPTRGGQHQPRRNAEGIIQCRSEIDKEACKLAHKYCQKQQKEYDDRAMYPELYAQQKEADRKAEIDFIQYARDLRKRRQISVGTAVDSNWKVVIDKIVDYSQGKQIRFSDLSVKWLNGFRDYLITHISTKGKPLKPNSQKLYLTIFSTILICAYKDEITATDLSLKVEPIEGEEVQITHFNIEELQKLASNLLRGDDNEKGALYSAATGFRHSDIYKKLKWKLIFDENSDNPKIETRQKKSKIVNYQPLSKFAVELLGKRGNPDDLVFPNLLPTTHINKPIREWVKHAGINKYATFHCFRHTHATLQITLGTDLYVVSKLLGHKSITSTQRYAKVVDSKKVEAVKKIKIKLNKPKKTKPTTPQN